MASVDSQIAVSTEVRRELKVLKAERDAHSYDAVLRDLLDRDDRNARGG